jgi:hypothetical protein
LPLSAGFKTPHNVISTGYTNSFTPQVRSSCTGHEELPNSTYYNGRPTGVTTAACRAQQEAEAGEPLNGVLICGVTRGVEPERMTEQEIVDEQEKETLRSSSYTTRRTYGKLKICSDYPRRHQKDGPRTFPLLRFTRSRI